MPPSVDDLLEIDGGDDGGAEGIGKLLYGAEGPAGATGLGLGDVADRDSKMLLKHAPMPIPKMKSAGAVRKRPPRCR